MKIKKDRISTNLLRLIIFSILSYGMVYFSYKYFVPMQGGGGGDFFQYSYMYRNPLVFSSPEVSSPFVYRQLSALLTHIVYLLAESGLYFNPPGFGILFTDTEVSQVVYFSGIVSNYIALVLCAWGVTLVIDEFNPELPEIYPLSGGVLCFLSVHSQQHIFTGLTEGWSWVLIIFGLLFYMKKSRTGILVILVLSIIQREMILVIFGLFAFADIYLNIKNADIPKRSEIRYELYVFVLSIVGFAVYVLMRTVLIPVPGGEAQLTTSVLLGNLLSPNITLKLLLSTFFVQNIPFLYLLVILYSYVIDFDFNLDEVFLHHIVLAFAAIVVIGIATGIGNNIGRISGLLTPITATFIPVLSYNISKVNET